MMDVAARISTSVAILFILFFTSSQGVKLCLQDADCANITSSSCVITTGCIKGMCTCNSGKTISGDGLSCITTTTTTTTTVATTTSTTASTTSTTTAATTTTTPTTTTTASTTTTHAPTTTTTGSTTTTTTAPTTTTVAIPTRLNRGLGAQCTDSDAYTSAPYLLECADDENLKCDVCPENVGTGIFTCVSTGSGNNNGGGNGSSALSAVMATIVMVTLAGLVL